MELTNRDVVVIRGIAELSRRYEAEIMMRWSERREEYKAEWFAAFDFFLAHVFFQGRRDTLSERYYRSAMAALVSVLAEGTTVRAVRFDEAWQRRWIPHEIGCSDMRAEDNSLLNSLIEHGVGKNRDRLMVLDALRYIRGLPNWNIVL